MSRYELDNEVVSFFGMETLSRCNFTIIWCVRLLIDGGLKSLVSLAHKVYDRVAREY